MNLLNYLNSSGKLSNRSQSLAFGNDISRILRGLAVIMMVVNHALPGKIIGVAAVTFSFLVGYGYNFSKSKNYRHSLKRIFHLLKGYWIVLLGICLPVALITYPRPLMVSDVLLGMFGLNPVLNFFSWYVWFYILAMLLMPGFSRIIDRYALRALIPMIVIFTAGLHGIDAMGIKKLPLWLNIIHRLCRFMPIVLSGYYIASNQLMQRIKYRKSPLTVVICMATIVALYFLRGVKYMTYLDFIWIPAMGACVGVIFGAYRLKWLRIILTECGMKSMNIWFLHALFFTHSTRKVFLPLVNWIPEKGFQIVAIIIISYLMACAVDYCTKKAESLLSQLRIPNPLNILSK